MQCLQGGVEQLTEKSTLTVNKKIKKTKNSNTF